MPRCLVCFLLALVPLTSRGQGLGGMVRDGEGKAVEYVTVIVQTADSVFVAAEMTDGEGVFFFPKVPEGSLRLIFQHLAYHPHEIECDSGSADSCVVTIREKQTSVGEITVTGERPQVTVTGSTLSYDGEYIARGKAVSTAFDVLKELPGVVSSGEELQLLGAGGFAVIINGQVTSLSTGQVMALLKNMPASRVKQLEVSYSAPARYNIKGAVINVVLEEDTSGPGNTQGELAARYAQDHYPGGLLRGNMLYSGPRFSLDVLAQATKARGYSRNTTFSRHSLDGESVEIGQVTRGRHYPESVTFRVGSDYRLPNESNLNFAYYFEGSKGLSVNSSDNHYLWADSSIVIHSVNRGNSSSGLHNVRAQYNGGNGLVAGADYTRFSNPGRGRYVNTAEGMAANDYRDRTLQYVSRWTAFANKTHGLGPRWSLTYGANFLYGKSDNTLKNYYPGQGGFEEEIRERVVNNQKEYTGNIYAEASGRLGEKFTATLAVKTEYFRADYMLNGDKSLLWNQWSFFPAMSLVYTPAPDHILQFHLTSDKSYPPYWAVSPQSTPLNSYMEVRGNPKLKPSREYDGQMVWVLNRKYTFVLFASHTPDRFAQIPYQSPEELKLIYRYENFDYSFQGGLAVVLPFNITRVWNLRLSLNGVGMKEKMKDFYGVTFVNDCFLGMVNIGNSVTISQSRPSLVLQLDGRYQSRAIQGIYTLGSAYDVSAGLKWTLAGGTYLNVRWDNITRRQTPRPVKVDWKNQYNSMTIADFSTFSVTFAWRFGNYTEKQYETVDRSRMGK